MAYLSLSLSVCRSFDAFLSVFPFIPLSLCWFVVSQKKKKKKKFSSQVSLSLFLSLSVVLHASPSCLWSSSSSFSSFFPFFFFFFVILSALFYKTCRARRAAERQVAARTPLNLSSLFALLLSSCLPSFFLSVCLLLFLLVFLPPHLQFSSASFSRFFPLLFFVFFVLPFFLLREGRWGVLKGRRGLEKRQQQKRRKSSCSSG